MSPVRPFESRFLVALCCVLGLAGLCGLTQTCHRPVGSLARLGFALSLGWVVSPLPCFGALCSSLLVVPGVLALLGIFLPEWDRTYITCVPGPRQPPLPHTAQGAPGELPLLAVGPCKPAASLTVPMALGTAPTVCAACLLLCLLGVLLTSEHGVVTLSGVWTRTWAHLTCT